MSVVSIVHRDCLKGVELDMGRSDQRYHALLVGFGT